MLCRSPIEITTNEAEWSQEGSDEDKGSRLYYEPGLTINGQWFHVIAYAVVRKHTDTPDGPDLAWTIQDIADETWRGAWDALGVIDDTSYTTQTINGRDYVIVITPHGD